jgi:hypothetical protein
VEVLRRGKNGDWCGMQRSDDGQTGEVKQPRRWGSFTANGAGHSKVRDNPHYPSRAGQSQPKYGYTPKARGYAQLGNRIGGVH